MANVINVGASDDPYLGAIQWGGFVWTSTGTPREPVTISYYLDNTASIWTEIESAAYVNALQSWANVANITIVAATSANDADLIEHSVPASAFDDPGTYGVHETPEDALQAGSANGYYNYEGFGWDYDNPNGGLNVGGNGYWTLIHELGHGLGFAHPHDNGGGSSIFPGVTNAFNTGDNGLNQGIWTVMSYIATQDPSSANTSGDGDSLWFDNSGNAVGNYGYYAGPMAFDIAAIQDLYGANTNYNSGGNTYVLPDTNALGTYWTCIWDTGGNDSISYAGNRNVTIDLTAATLDNSVTGGGVISSADGIHGGYTIANGVVIENAYGGRGADTLVGNAAANILDGGAGADHMSGGSGNDTYVVNTIADQVFESANQGNDRVSSQVSYTLAAGQSVETLALANAASTKALNLTGNELDQRLVGSAGANILDGKGGADYHYGLGGNDTYRVDNAGDLVFEAANAGSDRVEASLSYRLASGQSVETLALANAAGTDAFYLVGNELGQRMIGNAGANLLDGGAGSDILYGLGGADTFRFANTLGSGNIDRIADFSSGLDTIRLDRSIFSGLDLGLLSADAYKDIGDPGAVVDATDRILYDDNTGALYFDSNGSAAGGRTQFAILDTKPATLTHADFFVVA